MWWEMMELVTSSPGKKTVLGRAVVLAAAAGISPRSDPSGGREGDCDLFTVIVQNSKKRGLHWRKKDIGGNIETGEALG